MSDHRDTAHERRWWKHTNGATAIVNDRICQSNGWDGKIVPVEYVVCPCCNGKGRHVNPAIDENGLTQEDFDEDPDLRDAYFSGAYDVPCEECWGANVVPICLDEDVQRAIDEDMDASREMRMEYEAERRRGA